jgi:hypothetical protein
MQWNQENLQSKLSLGKGTLDTSSQSQSIQTHSSTDSLNFNESNFSEHSPMPYETVDYIITELIASNQSHVKPPLIAWHRPSAWQIDPTQDLTKMENLHFFYNDSSEVIRS